MIEKIVAGGQTGVDQAALDAAIELRVPHGGWCPEGRLAENGKIPEHYQLQETRGVVDYSERTKRNIRDSDATLIFVPQLPLIATDGTLLTIDEAKVRKKPHYIIDLSICVDVTEVTQWIQDNTVNILNVAGPRESSCPKIYSIVHHIIENLYLHWQTSGLLISTTAAKHEVDVTVFKKYSFLKEAETITP